MYRVTLKRTNETMDFDTYFDAEMFVKLAVMVTNERINRGIAKGKRDSKRNYKIDEINA